MNRRNEAAWKRTEFIVEHLKFIDTDAAIGEAMVIDVEAVFADPPTLPIAERGAYDLELRGLAKV